MVKKGKKIRGSTKKTIIYIKGAAAKFHKSSITFWVKAFSQPKYKQKLAAITQLMGVTDLESISVLNQLAFIVKQISN